MTRVLMRNPQDLRKGNLARAINKLNSGRSRLTVGIHKEDNKTYPETDITTAEVGFWQEFGHFARGYRSFVLPKVWLRIFMLYPEFQTEFIRYARHCFKENDTIDDALDELGLWMSETIKDRIRDNDVTPHSDKAGTTLIDTGPLISSINYKVKKDV